MPTANARKPFTPPPGFPIGIPLPLDISPQTIAHALLLFRLACESGNTARANELLIDAQVSLAEFAVHHFQAVIDATIRHDARLAHAPVAAPRNNRE